MQPLDFYSHQIGEHIASMATAKKSAASKRYFPEGECCIGVNAADITHIIKRFHYHNQTLSAAQLLQIVEHLLINAQYSEEVLIAFGLLNGSVKNNFDAKLVVRFKYWLENYATNWSHVDDLCIKTIYRFLLARPELITAMANWRLSKVNWCRRASCVVWVKFIERKIGKDTYRLDKDLLFRHCKSLLEDEDVFVQKSVGWLLKVSAKCYEKELIEFIQKNKKSMKRSTVRYAIEKLHPAIRKRVLNF